MRSVGFVVVAVYSVQSVRLPPAYASQSARLPATAMSGDAAPARGPLVADRVGVPAERVHAAVDEVPEADLRARSGPSYGPERNATE